MATLPDDILIVGLGKTGVACAKFLAGKGCRIAITDALDETALAPALKQLEGITFERHFGGHDREVFLSYPMIVISPGVDSQSPYLKEAAEKGAKVIGELELAARFTREPIIAVTGTNGKTTTTSLLGEIFEAAGLKPFVGGNIGNPFINYVMGGAKAGHIILEVSSFQLETIETFHPHTALLLNITEDHLDRYRSYDEYIAAKQRIFENQTGSDYAVVQSGVPLPPGLRAKELPFSTHDTLTEGAFLEGGTMHVSIAGIESRYERTLSPLVGVHNTENLLAALLTAHIYQIDREVIETVLRRFKGLPHRVEPVRDVGGIRFINDSKATNVDATNRALESMDSRVVLIAGGKDKGGSYSVIAPLMERVRALVLFGEAKEKIAGELRGMTEIHMEKDLPAAVERALACAQRGDIVLFSPMCSSFDQFTDYKERGNAFKRIVESL